MCRPGAVVCGEVSKHTSGEVWHGGPSEFLLRATSIWAGALRRLVEVRGCGRQEWVEFQDPREGTQCLRGSSEDSQLSFVLVGTRREGPQKRDVGMRGSMASAYPVATGLCDAPIFCTGGAPAAVTSPHPGRRPPFTVHVPGGQELVRERSGCETPAEQAWSV